MKRNAKTRKPRVQKKRIWRLTKKETDARDAAMVRMLLQKLKSPNRKAKAEALRNCVGTADFARGEGRALRSEAFKKYLESKDPELAAFAADGLDRIEEKSAADALIAKIRSSHERLKYNVIQALGNLKEIKAVRPIIAYGLA